MTPSRRIAATLTTLVLTTLTTLAGPGRGHERMASSPLPDRVAQGARPEAVDDDDLAEPGQRSVVQVAVEGLERLLDPGASQVQR